MQTIGDKFIEEGKEIGERNAYLKTARELIANGVDIGIIAKATGLPREEIEKMAETVH